MSAHPPRPFELVSAFVGSTLGIAAIGLIAHHRLAPNDALFLIGSFGASAVLLFAVPQSPLASVRNTLGGNFISALWGILILQLPLPQWMQASLAVSGAIALMQVTRTIHPPGGAVALIAATGSQKIQELGFGFAVAPVLVGALVLVAVQQAVLRTTQGWHAFWRHHRRL